MSIVKKIKTGIYFIVFMILSGIIFSGCRSCVVKGKSSEWYDPFYALRIPVTIDAPAPGKYRINIDPEKITDLMNKDQVFTFKSDFFAYNNVKLVEIKQNGKEVPTDGAFSIKIGNELIKNGDFQKVTNDWPTDWKFMTKEGFELKKSADGGNHFLSVVGADRKSCYQRPTVKKDTWYKFSYRAKGFAGTNALIERKGFSGWQPVDHSWLDPFITFRKWLSKTYYFNTGDKSNWAQDILSVNIERYTKEVDDVSLRECEVGFVVNINSRGKKQYHLYYAPVEGVTVDPPGKTIKKFPTGNLNLKSIGKPQWLGRDNAYTIAETKQGTLWSVVPTLKVLENAEPPARRKKKVRFSCAKNESEVVQLVFTPKVSGKIEKVTASLKDSAGHQLPKACFDVRQARYVDIAKPSTYAALGGTAPARYSFTGRLPDPLPKFNMVEFTREKNILIWMDVKIPKDSPAGTYQGEIEITTNKNNISVPLEAEVWDFMLPDRPTCRTAFGFNQKANQFLFPFHKVETQQDKYDLSRAYISEMAKYKISAKLPSGAGVWKSGLNPSPKKPEDFIKIYESELPWALDDLHVTGYGIGHYSGPLMGKYTRETGKKDAAHFEPIARFLDKKGWLHRAFIWIDEPRLPHYNGILNWVSAFRKLQNASKIKIFPLVYLGYTYEKLKDLVDIIAVLDNENHSTVSPMGIAIVPEGKELWFYYTRSAILWIDSPGINNRLWAPKNWAYGSRGIAIWGINQWWNIKDSQHKQDNPWKNPLCTWGNGALAFFYPPSPEGKNIKHKDMTIVPSLRLLLVRDGIEDYEYGAVLQKLVDKATKEGIDAADGKKAINMLKRPFISPHSWTLNEIYWQIARTKAAEAIVDLKGRFKGKREKPMKIQYSPGD